MKALKKYKGTVSICITASILLVQSFLFLSTWIMFYNKNLLYSPFYNKGFVLLAFLYVLLLITFSNLYGGYKIGYYRVSDVIYSQVIGLIFVNFITYMQVSLMDRRLLNPIWLIIMTTLQIIFTIFWALISNRIYFKIFPPMKIIIIYGNDNVDNFINKMNLRNDKYNICSVVDVNEGIDYVLTEIKKYDAVVIYDVDSSIRNTIVKYCYRESINIYITPKISDIIIGGSDKIHLFDTPLLLSKSSGISYEQKFIKRFIDILVSFVAIVIVLPIMIITAISIKLYDGGPLFFTQDRLTLNNRVFKIYKFRSMVVDAELDGIPRLATKNDDRITSIGKIIRKFRFDELPQLFNVLKGDMSIVGPRPERPEIVNQYIEIMPEFEFRTKVKSGLTGYAQIMGKYNTTPYDKLKLDMMYIQEFSLIMDFKIMMMTFKYLFTPSNNESTEGIDDGDILPYFISVAKEKD
jgi:exopolysaccharide biosynthesis polyprenyl glycosylphosphotransferase